MHTLRSPHPQRACPCTPLCIRGRSLWALAAAEEAAPNGPAAPPAMRAPVVFAPAHKLERSLILSTPAHFFGGSLRREPWNIGKMFLRFAAMVHVTEVANLKPASLSKVRADCCEKPSALFEGSKPGWPRQGRNSRPKHKRCPSSPRSRIGSAIAKAFVA